MFFHLNRIFLSAALLIAFFSGCGTSDTKEQVEEVVPADSSGNEQLSAEDIAAEESEPVKVTVENARLGAQSDGTYYQFYTPDVCTEASPCPAVVLVPDRLEAGIDTFSPVASGLAAELVSLVVVFNSPGRGSGSERSSGEEDFNGTKAQDKFVELLIHVSKQTFVVKNNIGIVSIGFGLSLAAPALARFQEGSLEFIRYLIDVEGPINRCYITQSPFFVNQSEGWYINQDGPGFTPSRCDFDLHPRLQKFPAGTSSDGKGTDGTPNSYICNENTYLLKEASVTCEDDSFFTTREPKQYLEEIGVHYLRLQFRYDHEQPTRLGGIEAIHWASKGDALSFQLNNLSLNQKLSAYSEEDLLAAGAFLSTKAGNGFGTDVYAEGKLKPITQAELFSAVLPDFIRRMQAR